MPEFGLVIKRLRRARRWTQEQLAAEGGFEQGSISQWESGKKRPSVESVRRLAEVLDQPEEDFVRRAGYLSPTRPDDPPAGDIFDRAPLARLDAELRALPTLPGQPTFAEEMAQLNRLAEEKRARVIRRLARDFLWRLREELEREEGDGAA